MSNGSDDSEEQSDSTLDQIKEIIEELKDDIKGTHKKELFKMAELLYSLDVKTEACMLETSSGNIEFALVIPVSQFKAFRKILLSKI